MLFFWNTSKGHIVSNLETWWHSYCTTSTEMRQLWGKKTLKVSHYGIPWGGHASFPKQIDSIENIQFRQVFQQVEIFYESLHPTLNSICLGLFCKQTYSRQPVLSSQQPFTLHTKWPLKPKNHSFLSRRLN